MRLKYVLTCIVVILSSAYATAAEWVLYNSQDNPRPSQNYYDKSTIRPTKESLFKVLALGTTATGSSTTTYEIDCKNNRIRSLDLKTYEKPMAGGEVKFHSTNAMPFKTTEEAANLDPQKAKLFREICARGR